MDDPGIRRLSWESKGRWVTLLIFVATHGKEGSWTGPLQALLTLLDWGRRGTRARARTWQFLSSIPGVTVTPPPVARGWQGGTRLPPRRHPDATPDCHSDDVADIGGTETVTVTFDNWAKYQQTNSIYRTRRWRERRHNGSQEPSPASPAPTSQASPYVTRSRSRVDKNPLTPVGVIANNSLQATFRQLQDEIMDQHPDWSARQVEDEAERRLNGVAPSQPEPTPPLTPDDEPPPF